MAVVVDSIDTTAATASAVLTVSLSSLTVGAGSNRALVAYFIASNNSTSAVTATWDNGGTNQAMTLIGSQADTVNRSKIYAFGLVAPTSGTKTLKVSWTGSSDAVLLAASFTGVDQTGGATSFAHVNATTGAAGTPSNVVTSAVGNYTVGAWGTSNTLSAGNQTLWWNGNSFPVSQFTWGQTATGAATVTYMITAASVWAFVGFDIVAAGGGGFTGTLSDMAASSDALSKAFVIASITLGDSSTSSDSRLSIVSAFISDSSASSDLNSGAMKAVSLVSDAAVAYDGQAAEIFLINGTQLLLISGASLEFIGSSITGVAIGAVTDISASSETMAQTFVIPGASLSDASTSSDLTAGRNVAATGDTTATSDSQPGVAVSTAPLADTAATSDTDSAAMIAAGSLSDGATSSDLSTGVARATGALSDGATSSDTTAGNASAASTLSDGSTSSDSTTGAAFASAALSDISASSDIDAVAMISFAGLSDSAVSSDGVTGLMLALALLSDATVSSDLFQIIATGSFFFTLSDSATSSDTQIGSVNSAAALSDIATSTDTVTANALMVASIIDAIATSDSVAGRTSGSLSDTVATTDVYTTVYRIIASINDAVATSDFLAFMTNVHLIKPAIIPVLLAHLERTGFVSVVRRIGVTSEVERVALLSSIKRIGSASSILRVDIA